MSELTSEGVRGIHHGALTDDPVYQRLVSAIAPSDPEARTELEVGRFLAQLVDQRERNGLTQQQVADRMGVDQSVVARLESGVRDARLSSWVRYAHAVGAHLSVVPGALNTLEELLTIDEWPRARDLVFARLASAAAGVSRRVPSIRPASSQIPRRTHEFSIYSVKRDRGAEILTTLVDKTSRLREKSLTSKDAEPLSVEKPAAQQSMTTPRVLVLR